MNGNMLPQNGPFVKPFRLLQSKGDAVGSSDLSPVQIASGQTVDQHLGGGHVGGDGDGVLVTQVGDIQHIVVHAVVLRGVEEEDHIDLIIDNALTDLLDTAVLMGEE